MYELIAVVGVGMGCKQLKHFLHGDKIYLATGKLGEETDTYNDTGTIVASKKFGKNLFLKTILI